MFYTTAVLKNLAIFTGKALCSSIFLSENAGLQSCNFIKKRLQHRCFPVNIAQFLRASLLKNICETLFERFPTWINNITSNIWREEDIFSKQNKIILKQDEKTCLFMMLLIISFFSTSSIHARWRLVYIIKDDSSEGL